MPELTYHKRIKRWHNTLAEKERYERKREKRQNRVVEEKVHISWYQQMKLKMMMNPKDYRDYLEKTTKQYKTKHKDYPDLEIEFSESGDTATISSIHKEQVTKELNWFEKILMFFRKLFSKK